MKKFLKFKIDESGYLLYSFDDGCTWESAGKVVGDASIVPGPAGQDGQTGATGADGQDGQDGFSPYIDETTGNWVDANGDTGVKAAGLNANVQVASSADIASVGTPSVTIVRDTATNTVTLQFHNLKGVPGKYVHFKASSSECAEIDDAYIDSDGNIQVLTSFVSDVPVFSNCGNIKGPKGDQGEHGIPGEGVHFKPNAAGCEDLNDGYIDANGHLIVVTSKDTSTTPATLTFTDYGSLIGPQGATGAAGPKGDQGNPLFFNNSGTVYDAASGQMIFSEAAANEGDYLIYTGSDLSIAPKGQLFRYVSTVGTTKIWEDQHFNICMLASNGGMDLDTLVNILRGYPLYAEGDGINIVPNVTGEFEIKVNVDNNTIKFDSQGRIYATGGGGGTSYTAGDGITIDGSELSANIDNETIVADENGVLSAVQPTVNEYSGGDGISITGSGTQKTVAADVDNSTIKIDSSTHKIKGNYAAGDGLVLTGGNSFSVGVDNVTIKMDSSTPKKIKSGMTFTGGEGVKVTNGLSSADKVFSIDPIMFTFLDTTTASPSADPDVTTVTINSITQAIFGANYYGAGASLSRDFDPKPYVTYLSDSDYGTTTAIVSRLLDYKTSKIVMIEVPYDFTSDPAIPQLRQLPVSLHYLFAKDGDDVTVTGCLITGWSTAATWRRIHADGNNLVLSPSASPATVDGMSPVLYCIYIDASEGGDKYKIAGFVIEPEPSDGYSVGIWGRPSTPFS